MIPAQVAIAFEGGIVRIYDANVANFLLLEIAVGREILQISSSMS